MNLPRRTDRVLLLDAAAHAAQEREGRNKLIADIAEIDARRAYRQAGYDSILAYCMDELQLSRKAALHRIRVARVAWKYSAVLTALAEGRLHVTAVGMLATHLTERNAAQLVAAAEHKSRPKIAQFLAETFPRPSLLAAPSPFSEPLLREAAAANQRPPEGVGTCGPAVLGATERPREGVDEPTVPPIQHQAQASPTLSPTPPERFPLKVYLDRRTHEKIRRAQDLLAHQVPSGDVAQVLDRALDALVLALEKRKFGRTEKPREPKSREQEPRTAFAKRYIPAHVKRAVAARDEGQCTFVSEYGKRCGARRMLEFDHIEEVARGGASTVENLRLRCRAHNQYSAELSYGADFMERKRAQRPPEGVGHHLNQ
jgi:5-methylcytosine-specific restriction endonuclease McrA